jgi:putative photosynthetic complex assembly protein
MSAPFDKQTIPTGILLSMAGLVVFSLIAVSIARITDHKAVEPSFAEVVMERNLRFVDVGGGRAEIVDSGSGEMIMIMEPGQENFIRGVIRGLARERRGYGVGSHLHFRLARHADGQLTLTDPATERVIDLKAFGHTNAEDFARLLTRDADRQLTDAG